MNAFGRFDLAELSRRIATPLRFEFTLHVRQCLRLDQQALSFVAATASTEADDDGEPRAFRFDPPREQRIALRRTRYIVCLVRGQASFGRPGLQQRQGFQYPRQAGLHSALDAVDLTSPPTLHRPGVEPPDPGQ
jgi:hypothetical protein